DIAGDRIFAVPARNADRHIFGSGLDGADAGWRDLGGNVEAGKRRKKRWRGSHKIGRRHALSKRDVCTGAAARSVPFDATRARLETAAADGGWDFDCLLWRANGAE